MGSRTKVPLTLAINDSDQVRDLVSGAIATDGIDLVCLLYEVEEIFFRFTKFREWDGSEMSLGKYCTLLAGGDKSLVGIPVFPSRSFRHSGIFIRSDGPIDDPLALAGATIGIPEWTVTATVYQRALLQHEYGLDLRDIQWVQAGINQPGRVETLPSAVPDGVVINANRDRSLNDLLLAGEIDAMLVPHPPEGFTDRSGRIVQLFRDGQSVEQDYYQRTGIFPIMHLVVIRAEVHDQHPWIAANLTSAFVAAKNRSLARLRDLTAPHFPLPWGPDRAHAAESMFGPDLWPYGLEANRVTLDAFLTYCHEQRLTPRRLDSSELFPQSVQQQYRI